MTYRKIVVLSPPFYSHFHPMLTLARALHRAGAEVVVACSEAFAPEIEAAGLRFIPLDINRNANVGVAQQTQQAQEEKARLDAFFRATEDGPIATLMLQSRHRQADMLTDPDRLRREIAAIDASERSDLYLSDQLSYAVTLALICLQLPFVTFCPGHPTYIPTGDQLFGVPYAWPREFDVSDADLAALRSVAAETDRRFTAIFNRVIAAHAPGVDPVDSAFRVASPIARLFRYPDFGDLHQGAGGSESIFMGYSFEPEALPTSWSARLARPSTEAPTILLTLGTLLSARADVLGACIEALARYDPDATIIVSAGANVDRLASWRSERVIIERFVPQKALLAEVDAVIHHGGNNSFTESLYHGTPMILMPFSSDQFAIAHDAQQHGLAEVLDPNALTDRGLHGRLDALFSAERAATLRHWRQHIRDRGPDYAAARLVSRG